MPIMKVEVCVRPGEAPIWVDGRPLLEGDSAEHLGIYGHVSERLLRYVAFLAARRVGGLAGGWVDAEELAMFVAIPRPVEIVSFRGTEALVATASPTTGEAVRSFFSRQIRAYSSTIQDEANLAEDELPLGYLVHYAPTRIGSRGYRAGSGRTRGPYRLGALRRDIQIDLLRAEAFWSGAQLGTSSGPSVASAKLLSLSEGELFGGSLASMRAAVAGCIRSLAGIKHETADARFELASLWELLSNLEMELGQPLAAIGSARLARRHFEILNHAHGLAHCLEIEAHAFGQLGSREGDTRSVRLIQMAVRNYVDRSRKTRKLAGRAAFIGTFGHRLSKVGRYRMADSKLRTAARLCEDEGVESWFKVWQLRAAENLLESGKLKEASSFFEVLDSTAIFPTVPQQAAYARVRARFHLEVGDASEGRRWLDLAVDYGRRFKMANQLRLLRPLVPEEG